MKLFAAMLGLAAVFALTGSATADDATKLVGKWEVTKSGGDTPVGSVVDFTKDGKMTAMVNLDGKDLKLTGTYKLDGKKLTVDLTLNDQKVKHEFTINFKGDELTLEDSDKKVDTLKKKK